MKLYSSIFSHVFDRAEQLGDANTYAVPWPAGAPAGIGVVAADITLLVTRNDDADTKILEAALVRNADGQVIAFARIAREIEGWEGLGNGALGGTVVKESQVLPVSTSDTVVFWSVAQADGLSLVVRRFPSPSAPRLINGQARLLFKFVQVGSDGRPVPDTPSRVSQIAIGQTKQLTVVREDGTVWWTNDGSVSSPAWTQIATP